MTNAPGFPAVVRRPRRRLTPQVRLPRAERQADIRALLEAGCVLPHEIAERLNVCRALVIWHLKQMPDVEKFSYRSAPGPHGRFRVGYRVLQPAGVAE